MKPAPWIVGVAALLVAGCSYGQPRAISSSATTTPTPRVALVTLGSDAAAGVDVDDGLHDLWSQQLFATELPPQTVYANLATRGATAVEVLGNQVPPALDLLPTVAIVWVTGDLDRGTPPAVYEADLTRVVERLQAAEATVLIAIGRPMDPVAEQVAAATGATPVDLTDLDGLPVGSVEEQRALAAAFGPAIAASSA